MDLSLDADQLAFQRDARAWLAEHVPSLPPAGSPEAFRRYRRWERELRQAGYSGLRWPVAYGGRGLGPVEQAIFDEEYLLAGGPDRVTVVGTNLLGPTLVAFGTDDQRHRWLPDILSAEVIWSQGFSEPDAGSDLASVRTKAVRDGTDWIVNGQKIWTSYGAYADWIFALVRTDPHVPKHAGITFMCIDMKAPGVEARPVMQLDGHSGFAEVFFTDVRVPEDQVIGDVNDGWNVAMTTLAAERDAPAAAPARYERDLNDLVAIIHALGIADDLVVQDRIGELAARVHGYRHYATKALVQLAAGDSLGDSASVTKLLWSELERDLFEFGIEVLGDAALVLEATGPIKNAEEWYSRYWYARAATIYAGTTEIQHRIIARRILGLPRAA